MPKVSVVIPCYNLGKYLSEAVDSVLSQIFQDFEIIIVDDGSTDEQTKQLLDQVQHPKLQVFHIANRGLPGARNYGIEQAKGEYICCLDADDTYAQTFLEKTVAILDNDPNQQIGFVTTWVQMFGEKSDIWYTSRFKPYLLAIQNIVHVASLFRRQCWLDVGGYNTNLFGYQDWDFWLSIVAHGYVWDCIEEPLFNYRIRANSMLSKSNQHRQELYDQIVIHNLDFYQSHIQEILQEFFLLSQSFDQNFRESQTQAQNLRQAEKLLVSLKKELRYFKELIRTRDSFIKEIQDKLQITQTYLKNSLLAKQEVEIQLANIKEELEYKTNELHELAQMYAAIQNSYTWRIAKKVYYVFDHFLMPIGSKRRALIIKSIQTLIHPIDTIVKWKSILSIRKKKISIKKWSSGPLVSVIIPCFNYGHYVEDAIDSVLKQTFQDFEIIVVEGGSSDLESVEVLKRINKPKTKVYFRSEPHLVGDNRNYGIQKAKGKYICCLDADDLLEPTYLEKAVFTAEVYHYDIVFPSVKCFGECDTVWQTKDIDFVNCADANGIPTIALFRKKVWDKIGGYRDWGKGASHVPEDWEFWVRALGHGYRAKSIFESLMFYRVHNSGLTATLKMPLVEQRNIIKQSNVHLFSVMNLKKIHRRLATKIIVKKPFTNLVRPKVRSHVLLALPFIVVGGAEKVLGEICAVLHEKMLDFSIITTVEPPTSMGDGSAFFKQYITQEIYHLYKFLIDKQEWRNFIFYLIETRKTDILFIVGCSYIYDLLPEIKQRYPQLKIIDLLFNEVGHLSNNRKYASCLDMTITENEKVQSILSHDYNEKNSMLINNGVDTQCFQPATTEFKQKALIKYGIRAGDFIVAFIGRLSAEKGPDLFVDIAKSFKDSVDIKFLIAGDGPERNKIVHTIQKYNLAHHVQLLGFVDTKEILAVADCLIVPSRADGRPNVVLEAMASGVPVIASAIGGIPTMIKHEETGFIYNIKELDCFEAKIIELYNTPKLRINIAQAARQSIIHSFSSTNMVKSYVDLFTKLLAHLS